MPRRSLIKIICACALFSLLIPVFCHSSISVFSSLLALTVFWIGILPGLLFLNKRETRQVFLPILSLVGVFYAIFFGMSSFVSHHLAFLRPEGLRPEIHIYDKIYDHAVSPEAQLTVISGLISMYVAYFGFTKLGWGKLQAISFIRSADCSVFRLSIWLLLVVYLAYLYLPPIRSIPSIGQIAQPAGFICFGTFYLFWKTGKINKKEAILVFLILFPAGWIKLLSTTLLTPLLLYFIYFLLLEFWLSRKIHWGKMLSALIIIGFIYPFLPTIRAHFWSDDHTSVINMLEKRFLSITKALSSDEEGNEITVTQEEIFLKDGSKCVSCNFSSHRRQELHSFRGLVQRISHISVLTVVVGLSPREVPFLNGESYLPLLTKLVPRVFWADKPEERFGNTFGKRYGFLPEGEDGTNSINMPWLTEMYANFGIVGVLGGMFFVGLLLSGLERFSLHWTMSKHDQIVGASIFFPLFYQDSNFSLMVGALPLTVIVFWIFFRVVTFKSFFQPR